MRTLPRTAAAVVALGLVLTACSSDGDEAEPETSSPAADATPDDGASEAPADTGPAINSVGGGDGPTVKIGMINQENSPLLSAPEVRTAAEGAVQYVNAELGGIGGVPIELVTCVQNSVEQMQACTQQLASDPDIVSVINGVNLFTSAFDFYGTLGDKPVVGGVPLFPADFSSPDARYFFGGSLSAFAGIGRYAFDTLGGQRIGVLYGSNAAGLAAKDALETIFEVGQVEAEFVPVPSPSTDVTPQVTQVASGFDVIVVVTAAAECAPVMQAVHQLGIAKETVVYTGTCGDEEVLDAVGDLALGSIMHFTLYNSDMIGVPDDKLAETLVQNDIYANYAPDTPSGGLAALGITAVMNIRSLYEEIGVDNLDKATILAAMDDGTPHNAFIGTPWICGVNPAFPSICNADNFFAPITEDGMWAIGDPVDALVLIAQAAAAGG